MNTKLPVGITMGDAAGIGPEIVVQACAQGLRAPHVVYGDAGALRRAAAALGARLDVVEITSPAQASLRAGLIEVIGRGPALPADLPPGQLSAQAGRGAYDYVCAAIDDAQAGAIRAIVTAPLNKHSMHLAGIDYPGHTEILAERSGTTDFAMMLANDELRVLLVTIHVALADVIARITPQAELSALRLADRACRQMGIARPRVAVAGLNPHAGEGGKFGREEIEVIEPAIARALDRGINARGPYPADTLFQPRLLADADCVLAMYHDQGLAPLKYGTFGHGVNITLGLPFVRTSVDHGTALTLAGTGRAEFASMLEAIDTAIAMARSAARAARS